MTHLPISFRQGLLFSFSLVLSQPSSAAESVAQVNDVPEAPVAQVAQDSNSQALVDRVKALEDMVELMGTVQPSQAPAAVAPAPSAARPERA